MQITKQQSKSLQGIAVILLLMHHLFGFPDQFPEMQKVIYLGSINGMHIETAIGIFGKICVAMFVFLSGYGLATKNDISYSYVFSRLKNIYFFYWITLILFVSVGIVFFSDRSGFVFNPISVLLDLIGITHHYNVSTWFFSTYVLCLLLVPVVINFRPLKLLLIAILILFLSHHAMRKGMKWGFSHHDLYMIVTSYFYYLFPFMAGIIFNKLKISQQKLIIYCISFIIFFTILYLYPRTITAYFIITPFFIILLLPIVSIKYILQFLSFLGKNALGIWLTHTYFYYYFFTGEIYSLRYSLLILVTVLALSLFATYLCNSVLKIVKAQVRAFLAKQAD